MKKLISALLALYVLLMSAVGYAEEIKTELELPEYIPTGSYTGNEEICTGIVEAPISLFSSTPQTPFFDFIYEILYNCDINYYDNGYIKIPIYDKGYRITKSQMSNMFEQFTTEYGELLLDTECPYELIKDGAGIWINSISFKYVFEILNNEGNPDSTIIKNKRAKIDEKVNPFINSLDSSLSELEKVLLTHDFIAQNAIYQPVEELVGKPYYHTLYSAIVEGETVCQGYTLAMCYILNKLGVDCVACISNEIEHVWNCVKVDGKWYHVDLTWDDAFVGYDDFGKKLDYINYQNFMLSYDKTFALKNDYYEKNYKKENSPETVSFIYPSLQAVTDSLTNNSEFESGYLFNSVIPISFPNKDTDGTDYKEHIYPIGFTYSDGRLVHKVSTTGRSIFEKEYGFIYNSLYATDYGVSVPVRNSSYGYIFLFSAQNIPISDLETYGGYIKSDAENNGFAVRSFSAKRFATIGNYYAMALINDSDMITLMDNSNKTEFFFWDGNMRPLTQKTAYQNQ